MSVFAGPNAVENGLILCLDAANSKSYPGSGTTWTDLSGNGNNGTLVNGPTYSANNNGYLSVDGGSQYIIIVNTNYPSSVSDAFSVESFLNIPSDATWSDGTNYGNILTRGTYAGSHGLARLVSDNDIAFWVRGDSGLGYASATIGRDRWYHCIGTWSGSTAKIYIDGSLVSSSNLSLAGSFESTVWYIASTQGLAGAVGNRFKGSVANAKIYNRELSDLEVKQNFNALRGRFGL
jgi:hypothetical protein